MDMVRAIETVRQAARGRGKETRDNRRPTQPWFSCVRFCVLIFFRSSSAPRLGLRGWAEMYEKREMSSTACRYKGK